MRCLRAPRRGRVPQSLPGPSLSPTCRQTLPSSQRAAGQGSRPGAAPNRQRRPLLVLLPQKKAIQTPHRPPGLLLQPTEPWPATYPDRQGARDGAIAANQTTSWDKMGFLVENSCKTASSNYHVIAESGSLGDKRKCKISTLLCRWNLSKCSFHCGVFLHYSPTVGR